MPVRLLLRFIMISVIVFYASAFLGLIHRSLEFVSDFSAYHHIDQSHNAHHSREVLHWALDILENDVTTRVTKAELEIIIQSCVLHDMVDSKYYPDIPRVRIFLQSVHPAHHVETMINIITTMSYSKVFKHGFVEFPAWLDHSPYQRAYHVVREADLLSSFNIARMIEYRQARGMPPHEIKDDIRTFYETRVARLVDQGHFVHAQSIARAKELDAVSRLKLATIEEHPLVTDLGYFRIVDYLTAPDLARRCNNLMGDDAPAI